VEIVAQGLIGVRDIFIHPNYLSSVTIYHLDPVGFWLILLIVIGIPMWWFFYLYMRRLREKVRKRGPPRDSRAQDMLR